MQIRHMKNIYHYMKISNKKKVETDMKNLILNFLEECKKDHTYIGIDTEHIEILLEVFKTRFNNEYKRYNNNEDRDFDEYNIDKIMEQVRIFVNEFYMIGREENGHN